MDEPKTKDIKNILIFYHDKDLYTESFYKDLIMLAQDSGIEAKSINYLEDKQEITKKLTDLKREYDRNKTMLILLDDAHTQPEGEKIPLEILKVNNTFFRVAGNNSLYDTLIDDFEKIQNVNYSILNDMAIALPWYPSEAEYKRMKEIFEGDIFEQILEPDAKDKPMSLWAMAMSYDATQMLTEAISTQIDNQSRFPSKMSQSPGRKPQSLRRKHIKDILSDPDFKSEGLTGLIKLVGPNRQNKTSPVLVTDCNRKGCKLKRPD